MALLRPGQRALAARHCLGPGPMPRMFCCAHCVYIPIFAHPYLPTERGWNVFFLSAVMAIFLVDMRISLFDCVWKYNEKKNEEEWMSNRQLVVVFGRCWQPACQHDLDFIDMGWNANSYYKCWPLVWWRQLDHLYAASCFGKGIRFGGKRSRRRMSWMWREKQVNELLPYVPRKVRM